MQICKLLFRICVAAVKTTMNGETAVYVCVRVCVYEQRRRRAQITNVNSYVCVRTQGASLQDEH